MHGVCRLLTVSILHVSYFYTLYKINLSTFLPQIKKIGFTLCEYNMKKSLSLARQSSYIECVTDIDKVADEQDVSDCLELDCIYEADIVGVK